MPRGAEARAWWAEVEDVKERIEHRRASERDVAARRTVSITGRPSSSMGAARLHLVESAPPSTDAEAARRYRHRPRASVIERTVSRPDRVAALAVILGLLLVLSAVLSAHG
jgi:hypothetical protein